MHPTHVLFLYCYVHLAVLLEFNCTDLVVVHTGLYFFSCL